MILNGKFLPLRLVYDFFLQAYLHALSKRIILDPLTFIKGLWQGFLYRITLFTKCHKTEHFCSKVFRFMNIGTKPLSMRFLFLIGLNWSKICFFVDDSSIYTSLRRFNAKKCRKHQKTTHESLVYMALILPILVKNC